MNKPVSFELAKLLKENDYTKPSFHFYENEKLIEPYLENGSSTDTEFRVDLSDLKEYFNKWSKRISAPTVIDVVMWLHEEKGLYIFADCDAYGMYFYPKIYTSSKDNWQNLELRDKVFLFPREKTLSYSTPSEACEAAIKYILENILVKPLTEQQ